MGLARLSLRDNSVAEDKKKKVSFNELFKSHAKAGTLEANYDFVLCFKIFNIRSFLGPPCTHLNIPSPQVENLKQDRCFPKWKTHQQTNKIYREKIIEFSL